MGKITLFTYLKFVDELRPEQVVNKFIDKGSIDTYTYKYIYIYKILKE